MGVGIAYAVGLTFTGPLWKFVCRRVAQALKSLSYPPILYLIDPMDGFNIIWFKLPIVLATFISAPWVLYRIQQPLHRAQSQALFTNHQVIPLAGQRDIIQPERPRRGPGRYSNPPCRSTRATPPPGVPSTILPPAKLRALLLASGVPAIVVTHDRMGAAALGDWMAVMVDGRIRQTGTVQEVFRRPARVAMWPPASAWRICWPRRSLAEKLDCSPCRWGAMIECVDNGETGPVLACIRAEDIAISREPAESTARNRPAGRVLAVAPEGPLARVELNCGFPLVALVTAHSAAGLHLAAGDAVSAIIKTTSVHLTAHA